MQGQKSGDEDEKQGSPWENLATSLGVRWEDVQLGWMFPSRMVFKPIQPYFPGAVYTPGEKRTLSSNSRALGAQITLLRRCAPI